MKRVLFIDDDAVVIRMIAEFLEGVGWEVVCTGDASAAGALMQSVHPDVVILDYLMPRRDGLQVLAELRALAPQIPVIIMTGYATMERCREAMQRGATDFLSKACDPDELTAALERALKIRPEQLRPEPRSLSAVG